MMPGGRTSRPSWIEHARISRTSRTSLERRKLAVSALAISMFLVAAIVWLIVTFL
jgi:hypothetical protein